MGRGPPSPRGGEREKNTSVRSMYIAAGNRGCICIERVCFQVERGRQIYRQKRLEETHTHIERERDRDRGRQTERRASYSGTVGSRYANGNAVSKNKCSEQCGDLQYGANIQNIPRRGSLERERERGGGRGREREGVNCTAGKSV